MRHGKGKRGPQTVISWSRRRTNDGAFQFLSPDVRDRMTGQQPTHFFARFEAQGEYADIDPTGYVLTRQARSKHARRHQWFPATGEGFARMCDTVDKWARRNFYVAQGGN